MRLVALKVLRKDELNDRIGVVVGTRPGIIKLSPVIRELQRQNADFFVVHTGQHYSHNMDQTFFDDLGLAQPKYKLEEVQHCVLHGEQTGEMLRGCEKAFMAERPKVVVVGGDANTNLAGAMAARKLQIAVAHVEAGLRSHDWRMPEEHNRVMIDHISDHLFAPTERARQNLIEDSVRGNILLTGNPIVDAVLHNKQIATDRSRVLADLGLEPGGYFLLTVHREETVDVQQVFTSLLEGVAQIAQRHSIPILFPMHPRTRNRIADFGLTDKLKALHTVRVIEPVGYLDFLSLLSNTRLVITDSGGIQEESCILRVPCVTVRESTERPETVDVGANVTVGTDPTRLAQGAETMLNREPKWDNPFGDGTTAKQIVDYLMNALRTAATTP